MFYFQSAVSAEKLQLASKSNIVILDTIAKCFDKVLCLSFQEDLCNEIILIIIIILYVIATLQYIRL